MAPRVAAPVQSLPAMRGLIQESTISRRNQPVLVSTRGQAADPPGDRGPSKTQRKRDMHALQSLGEALVALTPQRLAHIPLDDRLRAEIEEAQRTSSHEGRRRQLQFIGKLMREVDGEAIRAALDRINDGHRAATALFHQAESWRERLLEDETALARWCAEFNDPPAPLREAVNGARAELAQGQGGRRYRELFRHLRERLLSAAGTPANRSDGDAGRDGHDGNSDIRDSNIGDSDIGDEPAGDRTPAA